MGFQYRFLALRSMGYKASVEILPESEHTDVLARVRLGTLLDPTSLERRLIDAMFARRTHRHRFMELPVYEHLTRLAYCSVLSRGSLSTASAEGRMDDGNLHQLVHQQSTGVAMSAMIHSVLDLRGVYATVACIALGACRPTAGYETVPLTSINQFPPPSRSVEQPNDGTQLTPPAGRVPRDRASRN